MKKSTASRLAFAAFAAACIGAPPASALHRCVSKEGKVTYTEFECADGVKKSDVKIYDSAGVESKGAGADSKKGSAPVKSGPTPSGAQQKGPATALEQERRERDQREQAAEDKRRKDIEEQSEKTRKATGGR